jgi:Skp family chaperone for outer membrane proteins
VSAPPKPESKKSSQESTAGFPDTSEILRKMDRDLEEMKKRFEQLTKKMDEDLERIRKMMGGK